jgi:hypothetical protein
VQQHADKTLAARLERDDVLLVGQDHSSNRYLIHGADRLAHDCVSVMTHLAFKKEY